MRNILSLLILLVVIWSCKETQKEYTQEESLADLFAMMQGSFNSEAQAKADKTYYNISLHMYPIWKDKGNWLYVEQALSKNPDKPYRQRIYEVTAHDSTQFAIRIYTIPSSQNWVGKWKTPESFSSLTPEDLLLRRGCQVILSRVSNSVFKGKTEDNTCRSVMQGATFGRSEVEITPEKIIYWDRGFDANGKYVWGIEKGGYIYDREQ